MWLWDILFPAHCVGCGRIGNYFCNRCSLSVRSIEQSEMICPVCEKAAVDGRTHPKCRGLYSMDGLVSFFRYDGVVKKAVQAIKYRLVSDLVAEFTSFIPDTSYNFIINNIGVGQSIMVPIPLHPQRYCQRGFNQAQLLADQLSKHLKIPVINNLLRRIKYTEPQVKMKKRYDRLKNMDNVFSINHETMKQCSHECVILVDDVFTTGATMRAAANVLKRAGVKTVWGMTMAR